MTDPPPKLGYAGPATRAAASVEPTPDGVRVRLHGYGPLTTAAGVAAAVALAAFTFAASAGAVAILFEADGMRPSAGCVLLAVALGSAFAYTVRDLRRQRTGGRVYEATAAFLIHGHLNRDGSLSSAFAWRREQIVAVEPGPSPGQVRVRFADRPSVRFRVGRHRDAAVAVAAVLRSTLGLPPVE